ncbi:MAG: RDD family protein [Chitinophagaceae bacterium]
MVATIVDYIVLAVFFVALFKSFGEPNEEGGYTVSGLPASMPLLFWFCYFVLAETFFKRTLGHYIFGLRVVSIANEGSVFFQSLKRRLADLVEIVWCFGLIAIVLVKNTKFNQRLGDILAKTIVVDLNDEEQKELGVEFDDIASNGEAIF